MAGRLDPKVKAHLLYSIILSTDFRSSTAPTLLVVAGSPLSTTDRQQPGTRLRLA
jgi:hypothetical protein